MADKLIILVVLAAVVQASLSASDLKAAEETSRTEWGRAADIICEVIRNKSFPIEAAKVEYEKHHSDGGKPFFEAAHLTDYPEIIAIASAEIEGYREILFKALKEARECTNYTTTKAAMKNYKNSLPYGKFLRAFHAVTKDTGSVTPAVDAVKKYSEMVFNEIQKLAKSVCGGGNACVNTCPAKKLHEEIDAQARILYSWL